MSTQCIVLVQYMAMSGQSSNFRLRIMNRKLDFMRGCEGKHSNISCGTAITPPKSRMTICCAFRNVSHF